MLADGDEESEHLYGTSMPNNNCETWSSPIRYVLNIIYIMRGTNARLYNTGICHGPQKLPRLVYALIKANNDMCASATSSQGAKRTLLHVRATRTHGQSKQIIIIVSSQWPNGCRGCCGNITMQRSIERNRTCRCGADHCFMRGQGNVTSSRLKRMRLTDGAHENVGY